MGECFQASHHSVSPRAALEPEAAASFPPSLSSCDAKGAFFRREGEAIYYRGGEVEIVRESVNRMMRTAHGDGAEKRSEKGYVFVKARVICVHLCEAATASECSFDLCHHGVRGSASDCSFRI